MVIRDLKRPFAPPPPQMVVLTPPPLEMRPRASGDTRAAREPALVATPTTSITRVMLTLAFTLCLTLLLTAQGLVHAGEGMPDGPARTATLDLGHAALRVATAAHLTWPWDRLQVALGHGSQPSVAPLLSTVPVATHGSRHRPPVTRRAIRPTTPPALHRITTRRPRPAPQPRAAGAPPGVRPLRTPTPAAPLRVLVTGDSLSGYLGPQLIDELSHVGPIRGFTETHDGTGLTRPDFVDWSVVARQQVAGDNPDAVVVLMGGNDFQNMTLPGGKFFLAGSAAWTREYQRRAAICMRIWSQNGTRRVYWLSMPPARDPAWAFDDAQINIALQRAAATVPGAEYINILGPITNRGQYADFVNVDGQPTLIREPDGVHLNIAGSTIVANEMVPIIAHQWHLHWPPAPPKKHHRKR